MTLETINTPEDYALHLAHMAATMLSIVVTVSSELRWALSRLTKEQATSLLVEAAKREAAASYMDFMCAVGPDAKSWVASGAIDRMFGAIVESVRQAEAKAAAKEKEPTNG